MEDRPDEGGLSRRLERLVRALTADLDTVLAALNEEQRAELTLLLATAPERLARQVLLDLEEILVYADLPDEHPLSQALASDRLSLSSDVVEGLSPANLVALLLSAVQPGLLRADQDPQPTNPDYVARLGVLDPSRGQSQAGHGSYRSVLDRLSGVGSVDPAEVRRAGGDPDHPDLIRFRIGERIRLPQFQFDASGAAQLVVLEVNRVLGAEHDPWGVTSWWTDLHAWLERAPIELLDEPGGADELSELARVEASD